MQSKFHFLLFLCLCTSLASLSAQTELTVADGSENSEFIPIFGLFADEPIRQQMIYPANMLTPMEGANISSITFYLSSLPGDNWTCNFQCDLGNTSQNDFVANPNQFISTTFTTVFSDAINIDETSHTLTLTFSVPYTYTGGNLLIDMHNTGICEFLEASFYGIGTSNFSSAYGYNDYGDWNISPTGFLPKTTFTYSGSSSCPPPENISITNIGSHEATLSWTPRAGQNTWKVYCDSGNVNPDQISWTNVTDTVYTFYGLTANTRYTAYIQADCGMEQSVIYSLVFFTSSIPAPFPFVCDFEDATNNTYWTIRNGSQTNQWHIGSATNNTPGGHKALYISNDNGASNTYSANTASDVWAYIDVNLPDTDRILLSFDWKAAGESCCDYLRVFIGAPSEVEDGSSAIPDGATPLVMDYHSPNTWQSVSEILPDSYANSTIRLYFLWHNDNAGGVNPPAAIDNFSLTTVSCIRPNDLIISNITTNSVTIDLVPASSNDSEWEIRYSDANHNPVVLNTHTPNHILLENLLPATHYRVSARTVCGQGDSSSWTPYHNFHTDCQESINVPQTWDFEEEWVPSDIFGQNNHAPLCWSVYNGGATSSSYNWNWMHSTDSTAAHTGTGSASCYTNMASSPHNDWLITPQLALTGSQQLSFFVRRANNTTTTDPEEISVWISDENVSLTIPDSATGILPGFTQLFHTDIPQGDYRQYNVSLAGYSGNRHIAFVRKYEPYNGYYLRLDDVSVDEAASFPPTAPLHCDFENLEENAAWGLINGAQTNQWFIDTATNNTHEGGHSLYISTNNGLTNTYNHTSTSYVWAYRDVQFPDAREFHLGFDWKGNGEACCDYLKVFIGTPATVTAGSYATPDGAAVLFNKLNASSDWTHASVTLGQEYANTTQRLYFLWRNDNYVGSDPAAAIDNISIDTSSCAKPAQINISGITATEATIHIIPATENDTEWQLLIDSLLLTTNNTTNPLTNLSPAHLYTIQARTICEEGDTSVWTTAQTFSTECVSISSIPQSWDFENDNHGGTSSYPLPTCWSRLGSNIYPYTYNYTSYAHSGNNLLYSGGNPCNYIVILSAIDTNTLELNNLQLSLFARTYCASTLTNAKIELGIISDLTQAATFLPLDSINALTDNYTEYTLSLRNVPASCSHIALRLNAVGDSSNTGNYNYAYIYIDDISLQERPLCQKPSQLAVSDISTSSATLSWVNGGDEQAWDIVYGVPGFNPYTSTNIVTVGTNPYTLTGLTNHTTYEAYIRSHCGDNGSSDWISMPVSFTTAACELDNQCEYTFICGDGYGDGWNNAYLSIVQDGFTIATISAIDHHQTGNTTIDTLRVPLCHLTNTTLVWTAGVHDSEISLSILGADGTLIFSNEDMSSCTSPTLLNFTSNCGDSTLCHNPSNITTNNISQNHTEVSWTAGGDETTWELQHKLATSSNWSNSVYVDTNYYVLGLISHRNYTVRIKAICDDVNQSDYVSVDFTSGMDAINHTDLSRHISLTPNPAKSYIELNVAGNVSATEATIFNAFGQLIHTVELNDNHTRIDLSGMAAGMYFVKVSGEGVTATKKFVRKL